MSNALRDDTQQLWQVILTLHPGAEALTISSSYYGNICWIRTSQFKLGTIFLSAVCLYQFGEPQTPIMPLISFIIWLWTGIMFKKMFPKCDTTPTTSTKPKTHTHTKKSNEKPQTPFGSFMLISEVWLFGEVVSVCCNLFPEESVFITVSPPSFTGPVINIFMTPGCLGAS